MSQPAYGYKKIVKLTLSEAEAKVRDLLAAEGFGVLTEIDVQATIKKKLNADFHPYKILGACNPPFAHQALLAEDDIGLLMPCNVVIYEKEPGRTVVAAIDPMQTMNVVRNPALAELAPQVAKKLKAVIERM